MSVIRVIVCIVLGVLSLPGAGAQEGADASGSALDGPLAPAIPARREVIDAFIAREVLIAERDGVPVRVVRLGHAGTLERPEALELPDEGGRALPLYRFDWLRANERDVEIRLRASFAPVVVVEPAAQVVVVSPGQMELLFGTLEWEYRVGDGTDFAVTAGPVAVRGRGVGTLERDAAGLSLQVAAGRFDVYRDGSVVAVMGAGQQRVFTVPTDLSVSAARSQLQTELDAALREMRRGTVSGERLANLWELTTLSGARYAPLEDSSDPRIEDPDIFLREIAEALRILAAHRFLPPPARGM
ncbi:MAG: hypothetical protein PF508_00575 [Spirochaeta sp.]|jgi:hypothetical protein|nr:hypothetical protein [Spirochaeta sp.]